MTMTLDEIVSVTINLSPISPAAQGFSNALIMGQSTVLGLYQRVKDYATLAEVDEDFATSDEERKAAAIWFSQRPKPRNLKIGRRFLSAQSGQLRGGAVSDDYTDYTGITTGAFDISINGTVRNVTAIDASLATDMDDVATAIQTRLAAALASTTCVWDGTRFIITSPTTGTSSIVLYATAPGSGTDVSETLGFTFDAGARSVSGIALEDQTAALDASLIFDSDWYGVANTKAASAQDEKDTGAWAQANNKAFGYTISDPNAYDSAATSDLFYYFKNLSYDYPLGVFSVGSPYAAVSALARALVANLDLPNSAMTLNLKVLPGVAPDDLTSSQYAHIKAKNGNAYVNIGSSPAFRDGRVANGRFFDEVMGLDWLKARLMEAVFAKLYGTPTKIPQTDEGMAVVKQACEGVGAKGKSNGLLGAGFWAGDDIGELKNGDFLENGYYVFCEPIASLSQAERDAREASPVSFCCIGAGALHGVNITVNFQR